MTPTTAAPLEFRAATSRERSTELRRALGEFIRSRRERITPEMVGMPPGPRRRTPGLRREEMALLSGIGITWYTWLEQGRSINVSAQVLGSIARVLQLSSSERSHIFSLAELPDPEQSKPAPEVSAALQATLDQLSPFPAYIVGKHWNVLASNKAHVGLVGNYWALPHEFRNTLWLFFIDPQWRTLVENWDEHAGPLVSKFRAAMANNIGEPQWNQLLTMLQHHSPEFREHWNRQEVSAFDSVMKNFNHPQLGKLRFEAQNLWLGDRHDMRMAVHVPRDDETLERIGELPTLTPRAVPDPPTK
ncbi:MAG: helix-turn-helix domain-containing protein [Corynebacteriales bacterium]|nr:helix-turn-helix domain-containing protein [Mycobacteriales bacterium]